MTHENARRSVSRLWLRAFAGIVSVLAAAIPSAASEGVVSTNLNAMGAFSQEVNGRSPLRTFATELGVYELDTALKGVRVWQRGGQGLELLRPAGGTTFVPYTTRQIEIAPAGSRPQRFLGVDAAGDGIAFKQPVGLDRHPTQDKIAVLSVGEYINRGLNQYSPSIQVYDIAEGGENGTLSTVDITFDKEYDNAFYTTTNGMVQLIDRIYSYPDVLVTTNYFSNGTIASVTTNTFMTCTSNLIERTVFTNWVYVLEVTPEIQTQTNLVSQTGLEDPLFINESDTSQFYKGFEFTILRTYDWYSVTTNFYSFTNYVWKYSITTNASYLSGATDVAFLNDGGLVASITADDFQSVRSGFLVFGSDPSTPAKIFQIGDLDRAVKGIAVDKDTGDIYAAVPDMAAVFRYKAPSGGWTSASPEPVFHDDFVAGVTNSPGTGFGLLSNPSGVSVWYPDSDGPILLVADTANGRVQAFDPNSLSWTATNWLGRKVACRPDGSPFDEEILPFVSTNASGAVVTNFYRLETTAFPLFTAGETGPVSSDPLTGPRGVAGKDGESVFSIADTAAHRVRLYGVDLSQVGSDEILSLFVRWPSVDGPWPALSYRDMAVANGSGGTPVVFLDTPHTNALGTAPLLVQEIDGYEYELHFAVAPARTARTFTLAVANGNGVVAPARASCTLPAGATEGVLTFTAEDGIVTFEESVSWRDRYGNWAEEGSAGAVRAVTNVWATTPAYTLSLSSGGYSTNATLAVANVDPLITNAVFSGRLVMTMSGPVLYVQGMHVDARDWVAADEGLRYLWWATTNINWGLNNLAWAVTNNDWAGSASSSWSEGPSFEAVQNTTASAATGSETGGPVTNRIELMVQTGRDARLPYDYDEDGILSTTDRNNAPFLVVCTVLDKDGGAAIITFPTAPDTSGTADIWSYGEGGGGGGGGGESTAVYAVVFTDVSGTNVTFLVSLAEGEPAAYDTVTLQSSTTLEGAADPASGNWTKLRQYKVGTMSLPATINLTPAGTGNVRFYRVVQP